MKMLELPKVHEINLVVGERHEGTWVLLVANVFVVGHVAINGFGTTVLEFLRQWQGWIAAIIGNELGRSGNLSNVHALIKMLDQNLASRHEIVQGIHTLWSI